MSNTFGLNRRRFLGSIAVGAATAGASVAPEKAIAGAAQAAPERTAASCDGQNLGLITAYVSDLSDDANAERHFAVRDELRAYGLGASEIRGRYVERFASPFARTVEVRGWYATGNAEDSGNLKGHLRKVGRKYEQQAVLVKGYYRNAVLHALTDLPALGLTDSETKDLGPFRHACLGAYYTLLTTAAADAPPVPFCDLEPNMRRGSEGDGRRSASGTRGHFSMGPFGQPLTTTGNTSPCTAACVLGQGSAQMQNISREINPGALGPQAEGARHEEIRGLRGGRERRRSGTP